MRIIEIKESFEGYVWWSNQDCPLVYRLGKVCKNGEECGDECKTLRLANGQNPFVVEGMLYDKVKRTSYCLKYVDGEYIIKEFEVGATDISNTEIDKKEYLGNRMGGKLWLKFLRYWNETEDANCAGMKVLTVEKNVFVGFKEKEDEPWQ